MGRVTRNIFTSGDLTEWKDRENTPSIDPRNPAQSFVDSGYIRPSGVQELTYTDPNGNSDLQRRRFPGNKAAALVYRLLVQDFANVDSLSLPHVIEAIEVLTYFGKRISVKAAGWIDVNAYTLRITNKDGE